VRTKRLNILQTYQLLRVCQTYCSKRNIRINTLTVTSILSDTKLDKQNHIKNEKYTQVNLQLSHWKYLGRTISLVEANC